MTWETRSLLGPFAAFLGLEIQEAGGERVIATWSARSELHQPFGILHGGVHCSVAETLASLGAALWLGDRGVVVGVNNNTDFLRSVRDGVMTSTATPLHRGRSQQLWLVETVSDGEARIVSRSTVRLQNLQPPS